MVLTWLKNDKGEVAYSYPQDGFMEISEAEYNNILNPPKTMDQVIRHFKDMTYDYINARVVEYDINNQTDYRNIESFAKYAAVPSCSRYDISVRFITWASNVWDAVNAYHATLTSIPTDEEFQAVLDGVQF